MADKKKSTLSWFEKESQRQKIKLQILKLMNELKSHENKVNEVKKEITKWENELKKWN